MVADAALICYAFFGFVTDLGFTYQQNLGRAWVDAELGTVSQFVEGVAFGPRASQNATMDRFIADGCQVIVTPLHELLYDYAILYPNVRFICLTCDTEPKHRARFNIAIVDIMIHQAGYIAGFVAASQEGVKRIGYVGSNYVSFAYKNENSFALGALAANPNITLLITHIGSWFNPRKERIASMRLIQQHDVDLLAYDSDSTTIVEVAREMQKRSIAIKVDGTAAFGDSNLLSRIFQWNTVLQESVAAALDIANWTEGRFKNEYAGFDKDALSLGTFSTAVAPSTRAAALQLKNRYVTDYDFTFCPGPSGWKAYCPLNASIPSAEIGGIPPNELDPCDLPNGVVLPEVEGEACLSLQQVAEMSWQLDSYQDLGLLVVPDVCGVGTRMDFNGAELCVPCQAGEISTQQDSESCEPCPQGRYASDSGVECIRCPAGQFSDLIGSSLCKNCSAGTVAREDGLMECRVCEPGHFALAEGQVNCDRCPSGFYNNGSFGFSCASCPEGMTTQFRAAVSAEECVCSEGSYRDENDFCKPCPEGMSCPVGSAVQNFPIASASGEVLSGSCSGALVSSSSSSSCAFPRTLPRHMALPGDPLRVYKCLSTEACPGGSPTAVSACGSHRDVQEVACGLCVGNSYRTRDGECQKCSAGNSEVAWFIVVLVLGPLFVASLAILVNRDLLLQRDGTMSIFITAGIFLMCLQTTVVYSQLSLEWSEPFESVFTSVNLMGFDMSFMKTECYFEVSPASSFIGRQLLGPVCIPILFMAVLTKKHYFNPQVKVRAEVGNAVGTVLSIFYIAVVTSAINPFVCYAHPSDNGSSMIREPALLCWDGDERHSAMVACAIASFVLVPVQFLAACVHALTRYPKIMVASDYHKQQKWVHTYRFLFHRFKPKAHSWGVALLFRNLFMCAVPAVIPAGKMGLQVVLLLSILLISFGMQCALQPWKTKIGNTVDAICTGVLVVILVCGVMRTDDAEAVLISDEEMLALGISITLSALVGILYGVMAGLKENFWPGTRYHFFISHHKAAAAAQARLLQMLIVQRLHKSCFLDSDDLTNLSTLFDTVKTSVSHIIVYMTRDLLTRPWCVGELVVAKEAKLNITKIVHPSFVLPRSDEIQKVQDSMAKGVNLLEHNITVAKVNEMLHWVCFVELPTVTLDPFNSGLEVFHAVVTELANSKHKPSRKHHVPDRLQRLVVSCDPRDLEAIAAAGIVVAHIKELAASSLQGGVMLLADVGQKIGEGELRQFLSTACAVVVLLTTETLQSVQQLQVMTLSAASGMSIISVATQSFKFPDSRYFTQGLPSLFPEIRVETLQAVQAFFERIAMPLSAHASEQILQAECRQIWLRVPHEAPKQAQEMVLEVELPKAAPSRHFNKLNVELRLEEEQPEGAEHLSSADEAGSMSKDDGDDDYQDLIVYTTFSY